MSIITHHILCYILYILGLSRTRMWDPCVCVFLWPRKPSEPLCRTGPRAVDQVPASLVLEVLGVEVQDDS